MELLISAVITAGVIYLIVKGYKPQIVLIIGGCILMSCAIVLDPSFNFVTSGYFPQKYATNSNFFDIFSFIGYLFSARTADFGINVMAIAGFAKYMDHIGASSTLAKLAIKPLARFNSPYFIMSIAYIIGQSLSIIIPSASGLGLLLMVTLYPVLIKVGVSPLSATAVIGSTSAVGMGPGSSYSIIAAQNAGIDVIDYFIHYQLPIGVPVILCAATAHYFTQKYLDKKHGLYNLSPHEDKNTKQVHRPYYYAFLPFLPLILLLLFRESDGSEIQINIVTAVIISITISVICQIVWSHAPKNSTNELKSFFDGMGVQFANVITLIVAGEVFASGLKSMGLINAIISGASAINSGHSIFVITMTAVTSFFAVILGSGHAPFIAFSSLVPDISSKLGFSAPAMILPMQYASGIMRSMSPISGVIVAVSGVSNISPVEVVKRTAIPMIIALIVNTALSLIIL